MTAIATKWKNECVGVAATDVCQYKESGRLVYAQGFVEEYYFK
jgi:hypothetical protein